LRLKTRIEFIDENSSGPAVAVDAFILCISLITLLAGNDHGLLLEAATSRANFLRRIPIAEES
jgi:hypothetical protein